MTNKTYCGISRDHSGSMRSIANAACEDYNSKIESIKKAALDNNQDTIVSVVECGYGSTRDCRAVVTNSTVNSLQPISKYIADGNGTPLFDSVGMLIEMFEKTPDANKDDVSFLVMAITDGEENSSKRWSANSISAKMRELIATDRWTFVFRVPRGGTRRLTQLGIPVGNILEWDQTEKGTMQAAVQDQEAFTQYFSARASGTTATAKFYTDLSNVKPAEVAAVMTDISKEVVLYPVTEDAQIRPFIEERTGLPMMKGTCFYMLTKSEPKVQDYKKILVRDKKSQKIFGGSAARKILSLPEHGDIRLAPKDHSGYDVFIQSTSVNRKLTAGSMMAFWKAA